jgi:hypothetical protein
MFGGLSWVGKGEVGYGPEKDGCDLVPSWKPTLNLYRALEICLIERQIY